MRTALLIWLFVFAGTAPLAAAQDALYRGGSGDGHASAVLITVVPEVGYYAGGSGDGYAGDALITVVPEVGYYAGGTGDGYAGDALITVVPEVGYYVGGTGDGYAGDALITVVPEVGYYAGGSGDGYAGDALITVVRGTRLYYGGPGDGYARASATILRPGIPQLALPADGATALSGSPTLTWVTALRADTYDLQLATSSTFAAGSLLLDEMGLTATSHTADGLADGTAFFWRARGRNDVGPGSWSATHRFTTYPAALTLSVNHSFGDPSRAASYRLVGLPGNRNAALGATIPGTPGQNADEHDWIAYHESGTDGSTLHAYDGSGLFAFRPGNGFWLISTQSWTASGSVETVALAANGTATIPLHEGWNIISNPLDLDVAWSAVQAANGLSDVLWRYRGSWAQSATFASAAAGEAYYVFNQGLPALTLPYPGAASEAASSEAAAATHEALPEEAPAQMQTLTLALLRQDTVASSVRVGLADDALPGLDRHDQFAPPGYFDAAYLHLVNDSLGTGYRRLAEEYRPAGTGGEAFEVVLTSQERAPLRLSAEGFDAFADREVYLVELPTARFHDLRSEPSLTLRVEAGEQRYRVLVGGADYIDAQRAEVVPERYALAQNYPNPFNPATVIEYAVPEAGWVRLAVYDVLGRRVAVLVDGERVAGWHRAVWDAERVSLASGVYIYVLQAGDYQAMRRMMYLR